MRTKTDYFVFRVRFVVFFFTTAFLVGFFTAFFASAYPPIERPTAAATIARIFFIFMLDNN
jgi:hypothetical protein